MEHLHGRHRQQKIDTDVEFYSAHSKKLEKKWKNQSKINNVINIIIACIYMPCNDGTNGSYCEFGDVLNELTGIMNIYQDL